LTLTQLTAGIQDAQSFDEHSQEFPRPFEAVWIALHRVLNDRGKKLLQSDKKNGIVVTDLAREGFFLGFFTKYYLVAKDKGDGYEVRRPRLLMATRADSPVYLDFPYIFK
jgi:hypothetical protein